VTKVFELLIFYSYIFVFFKIIERELVKYIRINKKRYKSIYGTITSVSLEYSPAIERYRTEYKIVYEVDGIDYNVKVLKPIFKKKRNVGETISLMYDIDNPKNYHIVGNHAVIIIIGAFLIYITYLFVKYLRK